MPKLSSSSKSEDPDPLPLTSDPSLWSVPIILRYEIPRPKPKDPPKKGSRFNSGLIPMIGWLGKGTFRREYPPIYSTETDMSKIHPVDFLVSQFLPWSSKTWIINKKMIFSF
jgi:hypothetical protein